MQAQSQRGGESSHQLQTLQLMGEQPGGFPGLWSVSPGLLQARKGVPGPFASWAVAHYTPTTPTCPHRNSLPPT